MSRHFYAFYHTYGVRTVSASTLKPIGYLKRFDTSAERDAWVAQDTCKDGHVHRESMSYSSARAVLEFWFSYCSDYVIDRVLGYGASREMSFWRRHATIDQLWDACRF